MNETVLKALMRLFAIVANVTEGKPRNERDVVLDYLNRQLSNELTEKYLEYFDKHILHYHPDLSNADELEIIQQEKHRLKRLNELCNQLNEELEHQQKIIILIHLLDFINRGDDVTEEELRHVEIVSENLKISEPDFNDARAFTFGNIEAANKNNLLIIDAEQLPNDPKIKHLQVNKFEGRIEVLHNANTTTFVFRYYGNENLFLNGHLVKPNRSYIWYQGSVIKNPKFGSVYYIWMASKFIEATTGSKFVFTARDIDYSFGNSPNGIKRFTFTEESGRLIGIIGGSGSGKSTLLKVLNGTLKPKRGSIQINGFDIHEYKEALKGVIGYVPQEDFLLKQLTVSQNLYYNAKLCFGHYTEKQLSRVVEDALMDFDLVEARDLKVGDTQNTFLSGGQRKRLNIALELMREPSVLFVDEPTSGLSSMDSEKVMTLLKRQTLKGKLVISILHQPSSDVFKLLDKLLVIDQGGRVIFYGNPVDAIGYFKRMNHYVDAEESECLTCGNINPDQILRNVEVRVVDVNGRLTRKRKTAPEQWYKMYRQNFDPEIKKINRPFEHVIPKSNLDIPSRLQQFRVFFVRDLLSKLANQQYLLITFLEAPLLALILAFFTKSSKNIYGPLSGYTFGNNVNIPAFLFMSVIVFLFLGLVLSAEEIYKDQKILNREKFLNLSRSSYLNSKIVLMFILSAIQAITFVAIGNSILEIRGMELRYFLILFTTACWANMAGLIISSGFNSVITIYILIPIILVPQLLLSGVVIDFNNINDKIRSDKYVPVIGDMMTSRWAYEDMAVTQFKKNKFENYFFTTEQKANEAMYNQAYLIPELQKILNELKDRADDGNFTNADDNKINLLKQELLYLDQQFPSANINELASLNTKNFSAEVYNNIVIYLNNARDYFLHKYQEQINLKEKKYNQLVNKLGGEEQFLKFKNMYYNKQLASILLNDKELMEQQVNKNNIVQLKDKIFQLPVSKNGRAPFYAPSKRIGNLYIDTFWFNIVFIWLFSGLLFVILYFDLLKKLISYADSIKRIRFSNRIMKILHREWQEG
jgi:ABC transport system ATP-binding/permease protein